MYKVIKKVWEWLDIFSDIIGGSKIVRPWGLEEVLEIEDGDGGRGILITLCNDWDGYIGMFTSIYPAYQVAGEVLKDIFINYLGGEVIEENGVEKYYFSRYKDFRSFCQDWVDNDIENKYEIINMKGFTDMGFSTYHKFYNGMWCIGSNKVIFTIMTDYMDKEEVDRDKIIKFLKPKDSHDFNYLYNIGCSKEDLRDMIELLK